MAALVNAGLDELDRYIAEAMLEDQPRLRRRLRRLRRGRDDVGDPDRSAVEDAILASVARRENRAKVRPSIHYPVELPISRERTAVMAAIRDHQVTVVRGETGSGKTTQLPKICLELGRGVAGFIGHTQPRRIAARTVAQRLARELGSTLGRTVGFKVRFDREVGPESLVKVMTDGILLAEIRRDRDLLRYDTLIIDEAHERSLNIDFLIGYVKKVLPRRPDLKVIITSATIDAQRISAHFDGAPVVDVAGRTYPVEIRYRPLEDDETVANSVRAALHEVSGIGPGDVLVFLAGEREIRECADLLDGDLNLDVEVLPLHARLNSIRQGKVFQAGEGRRRVILATNVAETSVTVPGIRFVVDSGRARISRYSYRTKVQRLPVEAVSQASAAQRAGRCGRVGPGICIRLYEESEFRSREEFTPPEIQRTNLASVILQMMSAGLGRPQDFPFLDPPDHRYVREGFRLLQDLGAVDTQNRLTSIGRKLARLPLDPQFGRMLLASEEHNCVAEILVIVSALGAGDPRDRSLESRDAAATVHEAFVDQRSDFITLLNLWSFYQEHSGELTQGQLRRFLAAHYLSPGRVREWAEVHRQLLVAVRSLGIRPSTTVATYGRIHRALLSGLFAFVGRVTRGREYTGVRGRTFVLSKGSRISPRGARWLVAAELVETSGLYAHTAARVRPEWIERAAGYRARKTYFDVHWDVPRGEVMAFENVALETLILIPRRRVRYEPVDAGEARQQFIWSALVAGEMETNASFRAHNDGLTERLRRMEQKTRRLGIVADEGQVFAFYDRRVPLHVASRRSFERWLHTEREGAKSLHMSLKDLLREGGPERVEEIERIFPDNFEAGGLSLELSYLFDPMSEADGVTVRVPLPVLHQLSVADFEWNVPGFRREKVIALLRGLPKTLRRQLVPIPDVAERLLNSLDPHESGLLVSLERALSEQFNVSVPRKAWQVNKLPNHLTMSIAIFHGATLVERGHDLELLRQKYAVEAEDSFRTMARSGYERGGLTSWSFGPLEAEVQAELAGMRVRGFPGLEDQGSSVALRLFDTRAKAVRVTRFGLRRLFFLQVEREARRALDSQPGLDNLCLAYFFVQGNREFDLKPLGIRAQSEKGEELKRSILENVVEKCFLSEACTQWDAKVFRQVLERGRASLASHVQRTCVELADILDKYRLVRMAREERAHPSFEPSLVDVDEQLGRLVFQGFVSVTPNAQLTEITRFLEAMRLRLEKLPNAQARDEQMLKAIASIWGRFWATFREQRSGLIVPQAVQHEFRWMLEELRVSAFAEGLGTLYPVSVRRCEDAWDAYSLRSVSDP